MSLKRLLKTGLHFAIGIIAISCSTPRQSPVRPSGDQESVASSNINDVLRQHDAELMAIPGIVGIAVGLMDDDKTLCLKVLAVKKTKELQQMIPKSIEGYPVVIEETGVIRPLKSKNP